MNNINRQVLSKLTQDKRIVYTAMMMDPQQIPLFNQAENAEHLMIGKIIHQMFKEGVYTNMILDKDCKVLLA
tara:strand:+ start:750 stop:965 length:216 start_codon:yes stop_codon:yes gene_type:complete